MLLIEKKITGKKYLFFHFLIFCTLFVLSLGISFTSVALEEESREDRYKWY